jgi:hypothetical protein
MVFDYYLSFGIFFILFIYFLGSLGVAGYLSRETEHQGFSGSSVY